MFSTADAAFVMQSLARSHLHIGIVGASRPAGAETALVFIHGIAGDAYGSWGARDEPGAFIARAAEGIPDAAIFVAGYESSIDAIFEDDDLTLDALASGWGDVICEEILPGFQRLVFIAHCLGGLLTTMALRRWLAPLCENAASVHSPRGGRPVGLGVLPSPDFAPKEIRLVLLDTLHAPPARRERQAGSGGIMHALKCDERELIANAEFWKEVFGGERRLPCALRTQAILSDGEGFIASWRPDASLQEDKLFRCGLPHDQLTRAPRIGHFPPLERVLRFCESRDVG